MQSYAGLNNGSHGMAVMTEGVREYEIIGEQMDTIALTLFRTFGFMGKENLLYRPGRASGEKIVATPDAQLLGEALLYLWPAYPGFRIRRSECRLVLHVNI